MAAEKGLARRRLAKAQLAVLDVFLHKPPGFVASAADVHRESRMRVSKPGALAAAERLVELGALGKRLRRPRRKKAKTPHFSIVEGRREFVIVTRQYLDALAWQLGERWPEAAMWSFATAPWTRRNLDASFVRWWLAEKQCEMRRLLPCAAGEGPSSRFVLGSSVGMRLPVRGPDTKLAAAVQSAVEQDHGARDVDQAAIRLAVQTHYEQHEEAYLVRPLLALIQASPTALRRFLGDWAPYSDPDCVVFSANSQGLDAVEHVLFRLVFDAVHDLSLTRFVPYGLDVTFGVVCPQSMGARAQPSGMLELTWAHDQIICFDAGFDTADDIVGGSLEGALEEALLDLALGKRNSIDSVFHDGNTKLVAVERNPENCWARVALRPVEKPPWPQARPDATDD
jgi:hypothetical protein